MFCSSLCGLLSFHKLGNVSMVFWVFITHATEIFKSLVAHSICTVLEFAPFSNEWQIETSVLADLALA